MTITTEAEPENQKKAATKGSKPEREVGPEESNSSSEDLEDINNILNLGEVPNIFTTEEKNEVVENMKNLEAQLDKSLHTEGGFHELFALFIREVLNSKSQRCG